MNEHPDDRAIESFVLGTLDASSIDRGAFVAHVSRCDACAAKLQREARLEVALVEVRASLPIARAPRPAPRVLRWTPRAAGAVAVALAAAALLLFIRREPPLRREAKITTPEPLRPLAPVVCPDGPAQARCVDDAHVHGLYVRYPEWCGAPSLGGLRAPGKGPAAPPFSLAKL
jgi:hypothetical protein